MNIAGHALVYSGVKYRLNAATPEATTSSTETLPILYLLKWCVGLFLTMLPCLAAMWAITVLFEKPLLSVGLNLLLVIPGILVANTPLWIALSSLFTQITESRRPDSTRTMLQTAQTVRTPSGITWDAADFVLCYKVRCFFPLFGPDAAAHLYV